MLAGASVSPFYSSSTTGAVRLGYGGGRYSRAHVGWPLSSTSVSKGCSPLLSLGFQAGATGRAEVPSLVLLVSAATVGLITWNGFGHSQRSFALRRVGKQT